MSALCSIRSRQESSSRHAEFLALSHIVERHARVVFRDRNPTDHEEAIAEAVASAFESYVALKSRGKDPLREFPTAMATFAALHVKNDRHVGGSSRSTDVLARKAQRQHGFRVECLPSSPRTTFDNLYADVNGQQQQDTFEERLHDNTLTPVVDQVCFRLDWPAFLRTLSRRDRALIQFLSLGHSAKAAANEFKLSPPRVTQLREQWQREWRAFQGEAENS